MTSLNIRLMKKNKDQIILEKVKNDYNKIASEFSQTRNHAWPEFEVLLPYLKEKDSLLDLGCGNGRLHQFLKEKIRIDYHGVDNSEKLLDEAKKINKEANFCEGDLAHIPYPAEKFDFVATIAAFHHLPSPKLRRKCLEEINRVLKNDGIIAITAWNLFQKKYLKYIIKSYFKALFTFGKSKTRDTFIPWSKSGIKRYYYAFTYKELQKLLSQHFRILHSEVGKNFIFICQKKSRS